MRKARLYLQLLVLAGIIGGAAWYFWPRHHLPDPKLMAAAETRMWQAYYGNDPSALAGELVNVLRTQFGLSYVRALQVGKDLMEATLAFQRAQGNYESAVLPP